MYNPLAMQDVAKVLEFDVVRETLASFCRGERAKRIALSLSPLGEDRLRKELKMLDEASTLLSSYGKMPMNIGQDLEQPIALASKGSMMAVEELEHVASLCTSVSDIKRFMVQVEGREELKEYVASLPNIAFIEESIHRIIAPDLSIYDNASPELKKIRYGIAKLEREISERAMAILSSNREYLSDETLTFRNGHYVLPVANAYKAKVKGIIQDISNSGGTTFIEPEEIVNLNNKMAELRIAERDEIHRLLLMLSAMVAENAEPLTEANRKLGYLDLLQGKALYGESLHCHVAMISDDFSLYLPAARHPLLDQSTVVANDFELKSNRKIVVISGPNAGGKTVALKTIAICALMFECGMMLPCGLGAELPYFKRIYLDIGDGQSISDNLSTFSAHMKNIAEITSSLGGKDLVLLDEVGTGTSPKEGEALAMAILEFLLKKHCYALVSSHFEGLKAYALSKEGVANASMLFDSEHLLPTYILQMGLPGESYGLSVAARFGLNQEIIDRALKTIESKQDISLTKAIGKLEALTRENAQLRGELERREKQLATQERRLAGQQKDLAMRQERLYEDAAEKREEMLEEARKKITEIFEQINHPGVKQHEIIEARKKLEALSVSREEETYSDEIELGDYVKAPGLGIEGKVTRLQGSNIQISTSAGLTINTKKEKVIKIPKPEEKIVSMRGAVLDQAGTSPSVGLELNLIGMHVDEATLEVDRYLDRCRLKGFKRVRIIHGFGSGALRKAVEAYLKSHSSFVESFEQAGEYEGGGGATVVHLK